MEKKRSWIAPSGILITLMTVYTTSTFKRALGLSPDTWWCAIFIITGVATSLWLILSIVWKFCRRYACRWKESIATKTQRSKEEDFGCSTWRQEDKSDCGKIMGVRGENEDHWQKLRSQNIEEVWKVSWKGREQKAKRIPKTHRTWKLFLYRHRCLLYRR